ncbi:ABC transporter substrate-binding protein [Pseudomonas helleri]|uniref:ABC transporter substrate-binding protein n=1 Tax=Pseudomonas helleri TaxID=1608996 RepID=A0A6A7YVH8_9PSED|nr:ABC transporter substrate-binding protein [Pseudomonas helleri]MQT28500.1 ABC transporter substrate-binding protein [Pseudomonas helleri]MQT81031.1 ABC transporter substrate-binding protein [Pseudomonas helleri]MQU19309.1 ABC transporter substrate-binding protein [Pseudomonas helleri]MQU29413.1 ABC transporter substrate-binding protein [Pseudomonas helleri]
MTLARTPFWPLALLFTPLVHANDSVMLLTSWYAQAEHGGFYQAVAEGLYAKQGLDVTIRMGGPQVNGMQLLLSKQADVILNYDLQVLKSMEQQLPVVAVAAAFQGEPQGVMAHADVQDLTQLKGKHILVSTSGQQTWWPWLKQKYGLDESQAKPYTFNLQPFLNDPNTVQQAYASSELFQGRKADPGTHFLLFADAGYPPYGSTLVTRPDVIEQRPEVLRRFIQASMQGWRSYLANPAAGNALIKQANPSMNDELLDWGVSTLKQYRLVDGGDAQTQGIGVMTDARWQATRDFMVEAGLLKADIDWRKAYDTRFVKDLNVLPIAQSQASQ